MVNDFISLLFPRCCIVSGTPLARGEAHIATSVAARLPRFDLRQPHETLVQKLYTFAPVKHAFAYYKFSRHSQVQRLLHHLKYKNCPEVGELAGKWFAHALLDAGYGGHFDLIVPIPLHRAKLRQRGYNQCDHIAQGLAQVLDIPWNPSALTKSRATTSQTHKGRWERSKNVSGIFTVAKPYIIAGQRVLLVDDVVTTGATLGVAAKVLLESSCQEVSVGALAATES